MNKLSNQYKDDVISIDSIIDALYDVISGEKGEERNWDRERYLFHPEARLIVVRKEDNGTLDTKVMMPDDFIQYAQPFLDGESFYEYEIARKVEEFGHVVHVWSTFGSKNLIDDSIQLLNDGKRWWIMNVYWNKETHEFPLPEKYCI